MKPETPVPTPKPFPLPEPTPEPAPAPMPAPLTEGDLPNRADVVKLEEHLVGAKNAIGEQNFDVAARHLETASKLAKLPAHRELVKRLRLVADYVKQFRTAVEEALKKMDGGESFMVGNTPVGFVEFTGKAAILRVSGQNKTYPLADLPAGLAVALADLKLSGSDPVSRVVKGAYLLMHHKTKSQDLNKAKELWNEAALGGIDMKELLPLLDKKYEVVADFDKLAASLVGKKADKPE